MESSVDCASDVRLRHIRGMLDKIVNAAKKEEEKGILLQKQLERLSLYLSTLVALQFILGVVQTTLQSIISKPTLGVLSVLTSITAFLIGCLGKRVMNRKKMLEECFQTRKNWEKAHDVFTMKLSDYLEDGILTSDEHDRLQSIYTGASDFVDTSLA